MNQTSHQESRTTTPFRAAEVIALNMVTSVGKAHTRHLCRAFELTRAALSKARRHEHDDVKPVRMQRTPTVTNSKLFEQITEITSKHPALGHRKVWALLRRRALYVLRRRVWKMMHDAGLTFLPSARRSEPRRGMVVAEDANRRWSTDMTTIWTHEDGLIAITPVIDNGCRSLLQIGVSKSQAAQSLLAPLCDSLEDVFRTP